MELCPSDHVAQHCERTENHHNDYALFETGADGGTKENGYENKKKQ